MLTRALRSIALSLLLIDSAAAISQMAGVQGKPYTATRKSTFVQKLADGTTIARVTTAIDARDSQGRTVHENTMDTLPGNVRHVLIADPVAQTMTNWWSSGTQATRTHVPEMGRSVPTTGAPGLGSGGMVAAMVTGSSDGIDRHTEKLGGKTIAGVYAEGTRTTFTYPVDSIGNDRPIITVNESWKSPDLNIIVLSTLDDPRTGLRTTELINLNRAEPDPSLFQVPAGYTIKDEYPQPN